MEGPPCRVFLGSRSSKCEQTRKCLPHASLPLHGEAHAIARLDRAVPNYLKINSAARVPRGARRVALELRELWRPCGGPPPTHLSRKGRGTVDADTAPRQTPTAHHPVSTSVRLQRAGMGQILISFDLIRVADPRGASGHRTMPLPHKVCLLFET